MSTITNLEKTSTGAASLTIINDNFDNLNTDKLEKSGGIMTGELSWNTVAALGLKIQSLTTAQRNVLTPANGHIIYNTTTTQFEVYENGAWVSLRGVAVDASTIAKGITKLSVAPAEATNPIAVGDNDSRLPTQGENDALAGTSGTPSGTNKYVTNDDTTTTASAGKLIRGKPVTGKLDESVCQTTDANITDLTDGGETTLHSHAVSLASVLQGSQQIMINTKGLLTKTTGAGTFNWTESAFSSVFSGNNGAGNYGYLAGATTDGSKDFSFTITAISLLQNGDCLMGLMSAYTDYPTAHILTAVHAGFIFQNLKVYASNADGTTQTVTDVTGAYTLSNYNTYTVKKVGSSIYFYINGTLVATHTTNLCTSAADSLGINFQSQSGYASTENITYLNNFIYTQNN